MIHNQAKRMATALVNRKIIDGETHEVYAYGFELIMAAILNVLIIALVSAAFRRYYDWLLYLAAFIPLRTTAGGYHASSHIKCIAIGTLCFTALLLLSRIAIEWTHVILTVAGASFLLVMACSPVEASNKKLTPERKRTNRYVSICITITNLFIATAAYFIDGLSEIIVIYFAGVFTAAVSMLAVRAKKTRRE